MSDSKSTWLICLLLKLVNKSVVCPWCLTKRNGFVKYFYSICSTLNCKKRVNKVESFRFPTKTILITEYKFDCVCMFYCFFCLFIFWSGFISIATFSEAVLWKLQGALSTLLALTWGTAAQQELFIMYDVLMYHYRHSTSKRKACAHTLLSHVFASLPLWKQKSFHCRPSFSCLAFSYITLMSSSFHLAPHHILMCLIKHQAWREGHKADDVLFGPKQASAKGWG